MLVASAFVEIKRYKSQIRIRINSFEITENSFKNVIVLKGGSKYSLKFASNMLPSAGLIFMTARVRSK